MEIKLRELLTSIDSRFTGPASCRLNDMLSGRLALDNEEIERYLVRIKNFGYKNGNKNGKDAEVFLNLFTQYISEKNK